MATQQEILSGLIAASTGELTDARLSELSATAKTLASLGPAAPPITRKDPAPDPKVAAKARIDERAAKPLASHAPDALKIARAAEDAKDLAIIYPRLATSGANPDAFDFSLLGRSGGDAA